MITWLADAIRAEGGKVREVPGWKTRGRSFPFEGDEGVMFHHTASNSASGANPALRIVTEGRSDLPGPLCHVLVGRDGVCWIVAAGYANHSGLGGPWRSVPKDSGNRNIVGVEVENNGIGEPWREVVLDACDRVFSAVLKHQKRDHTWNLGHKEWTSRKIDPSLDMKRYRVRLAAFMEGGDDMALFENKAEFREEVLAALGGRTGGKPNLTANETRAALEFVSGMNRRMAEGSRPTADGPKQHGWDLVDELKKAAAK